MIQKREKKKKIEIGKENKKSSTCIDRTYYIQQDHTSGKNNQKISEISIVSFYTFLVVPTCITQVYTLSPPRE